MQIVGSSKQTHWKFPQKVHLLQSSRLWGQELGDTLLSYVSAFMVL